MRLDNEPLSAHSAVLSKQGSPQFRYMKKNIDFIEQEIAKNLKGGFTNLLNIKNNTTPLASDVNDTDKSLNTTELECTMIVEDPSLGTENKIRGYVGSGKVLSRKFNGSDEVPSELPEMLVSYKDDTSAVKDICVDEEVLLKDKIIPWNEIDKRGRINVASDGNKISVMTNEINNDEFLSPDGSLKSSESDNDNASREIKCSSKSTFVCDTTSGEKNYCPTNKNVVDASHEKASSPDFGSQKTLMSFLLSSDYNGNELDRPTNKNRCLEVIHGIPGSGLPYKLAYNGDDQTQESQGESSFSRVDSSSERITGFSRVDSSSEIITSTGPMLIYSGSVSIRSDSSSTRSFAFPILQPEWHASPVKMAKPDRRKYRKHGGWKEALTCCRF